MGPFKVVHEPNVKTVPMSHENVAEPIADLKPDPPLQQVVVGLPNSKHWKRRARSSISGHGIAATSEPHKKQVGDGLAGGSKKRPRMENEDGDTLNEESAEAVDQPRREP